MKLRLENMNISLIMQPMRRTMLVMVLTALQLAACGGDSNGGSITTTDSSSSSALSNPAATAPSTNLTSSTAPPPSTTGSFDLNWTPPVARTDGSPLLPSEIDGFRIYLGSKPGAYPTKINVVDGSAQSTTVTNVAPGTYYLVMTAYDVKGRESGYSPVISKIAL